MSVDRKKRIGDLILIAALLLLALVLYFAFSDGQDRGGWAVVSVDGEEIGRYSLSEDGVYPLNGGTNVMQIGDGKAWLIEADCPDHVCIGMGQIQYEGQIIVCLPNRLIVSVEGVKGGADLFVG